MYASFRKRMRAPALVSSAVAVLALAACSSSTNAASGTQAGSSGSANRQITIGIAAITLGSPVVPEMVSTVQDGAKMLGWKTQVLNANGDPAKMASIVSALATQGVDAIIDIAIAPSQASQGFALAKSKNIPIIEIGAPVDDPQHYLAATYAPDDAKMATMVADQMIKDLNGKGEALDLVASGLPAIVARNNAMMAATKNTGIKVVATHETDLSNPIQDTQSAVADAIRAHPGINAVWGLQDFEFATAIQTIQQQHLGNVGVYSIYLDPQDFAILRAAKSGGLPMAVADSPIQYTPWYALDALVNKFLLHKSDWVTNMSIQPLPYTLVTPQNVQSSGNSYNYEPFRPFFAQRWKSEGISVSS